MPDRIPSPISIETAGQIIRTNHPVNLQRNIPAYTVHELGAARHITGVVGTRIVPGNILQPTRPAGIGPGIGEQQNPYPVGSEYFHQPSQDIAGTESRGLPGEQAPNQSAGTVQGKVQQGVADGKGFQVPHSGWAEAAEMVPMDLPIHG